MSKNIIKSIIWIFPFFSFLFGYYLMNFFFKTTEVFVPNLIGKQLNEAAKVLSGNNLNLRILKQKIDSELAENTIIDQFPRNQKIKTNKPVYLTISKKNTEIIMQDFRGKNIDEIKEFLNKNSLKSKVYFIENQYDKNLCIAQSHSTEKLLNKKEKIILYISSGNSKPIIIPDFTGINLQEVKQFLEKHELQAKIFSASNNKDQFVINQRPLPGSIITLNKNLDIQLQVN